MYALKYVLLLALLDPSNASLRGMRKETQALPELTVTEPSIQTVDIHQTSSAINITANPTGDITQVEPRSTETHDIGVLLHGDFAGTQVNITDQTGIAPISEGELLSATPPQLHSDQHHLEMDDATWADNLGEFVRRHADADFEFRTAASRRAHHLALRPVASCYEAQVRNFPTCTGYKECGYICVGEGDDRFCATETPVCDYSVCAVAVDHGKLDKSTGRCVTGPRQQAHRFHDLDGSSVDVGKKEGGAWVSNINFDAHTQKGAKWLKESQKDANDEI